MLRVLLLCVSIPWITWVAAADFDYYVLTRQYPAAICRADNEAHAASCKIPDETEPWTLHGLWPSSRSRRDIEFCTKEKFSGEGIKPIWKKLLGVWPNLLAGKGVTSFWRHEFEKHGTCALSELKDELGYFNTSITLHERYNIDKTLQEGGLKPSEDKKYSLLDIKNLAEHRFGGHSMQFHCVHDNDNDWLLADVRMCIDKSLNLVDCPRLRRHNINKYRSKLKQGGPLPPMEPCPKDGIKYIPTTTHGPKTAPISSFALSLVVIAASFFLFRFD